MYLWAGLIIFVVLAIAIDAWMGGRATPTPRNAAIWSIVWTAVGFAFAGVLALTEGGDAPSTYLAGFLIEKSLSLDNLFVFAVLFSFFAVPEEQRRRVLLLGIAGAIILRGALILVGAAAIDAFAATTYILGAILIFTAIKIARHGDQEIEPEHTLAMRGLRKVVPLSPRYHGSKLFVRENGKRLATPMLAALTMVAAFDLMFAIDSIPAIFAITQDTLVVFAANAFSLLGMVSLFFVLDGLMQRLRYLNEALALILGYVGVKLLLADVWHPPTSVSLAVVVVVLSGAAALSLMVDRREARRKALSEPAGPAPAEG